MARNDEKKSVRCSFCGKPQSLVNRLVAGNGVYICDECVRLCMSIIDEGYQPESVSTAEITLRRDQLPKPAEMRATLDDYIIGQDRAKVVLSVAVYNHYKRILRGDQDNDVVLKRGQKGLVHAIFSRFGLVLVLLLLQFGALFSLLRWFGQLLPHYLGGTALVTAAMVIYLLNIDMDNSVRITWLVVIAVLPVLGVPLFWYTKADIGHNALKKRLMDLESQTRAQLPQPEGVEQRLEADSPGAASLARYLRGRGGGFPVYGNTAVTYFNGGEAKFAELLRQLETAEHYIFLEYFIIDEGLMWGRILEVLARKAADGVDVRVMYDGTCEFSTLPRDYPKRLEALGIRCKVFAPVTPFVSTHYNYRDHRKILVIDGRVGFTGGVNLADEYINHVEKYGRWKDAAVMLEGEGVRTMTALFLQMWSIQREPEFAQFLTHPLPETQAKGFVIPYGDCPLDGERVGEMVYIDLLNRARHSVHIITPYLILDGELETALRFAAAAWMCT